MAALSGQFAVGEPSIDRLHEECEAMLAQLTEAVCAQADATTALERLHEHLQRHFAHEESLMAATDFPPASCHKREHTSVLEVVAEVRRRYAQGDRDPLSRLPEAVLEWFGVHASSMDAALAAWLNAPRDVALAEPPASQTGCSASAAM
jgi:hemerythrin-like metal-binding protein